MAAVLAAVAAEVAHGSHQIRLGTGAGHHQRGGSHHRTPCDDRHGPGGGTRRLLDSRVHLHNALLSLVAGVQVRA